MIFTLFGIYGSISITQKCFLMVENVSKCYLYYGKKNIWRTVSLYWKLWGIQKVFLWHHCKKNANKKNYFQECICNTISAFCLLNALENKLYSNSSVLHFQPRHIACKWHLVILEMSYYAFLIAFRDFAFCTKYIINSAVRVCYSEHNSPLFKWK